MIITLDAGALCSTQSGRYGTHTFTYNLLKAFDIYADRNTYIAYGYCSKPNRWDLKRVRYRVLQPRQGWMNIRVPIEEWRIKPDIFMGLSQAMPSTTSARIFTFLHGLSFLRYPHFYPDSHIYLKKQLQNSLSWSEQIFVSSEKIKDELVALDNYKNIVVLPYGIPFDMQKRINAIRKKQFIYVGMNHPIKRVKYMVEIFLKFRNMHKYREWELLLVGDFAQFNQDGIVSHGFASREELLRLYAESQAYLSASHYESYNFPVLEALSQGCEVVATEGAVIPEMKKFVHESKNKEEFLKALIHVANHKPSKNTQSEIRNKFSWQKTVKIIRSYY